MAEDKVGRNCCSSTGAWRSCAMPRRSFHRQRGARGAAGSGIQLDSARAERLKSGWPVMTVGLGSITGDAATVGWTTKLGGWSITDAGIEAWRLTRTPDEL